MPHSGTERLIPGTVRSVLYRIWVCPRYGIRGTKASEASILDTLLGTTYVGVYET